MKLRVGIGALACGLVFTSSGFADAIPVNNPSFEILPAGGLPIGGYLGGAFSVDAIPGWVNSGEGDSGQFQPGGPSGTVPNGYYNALSDGPTEAYTNDGAISQTVGATAQVGVRYTLLVDIGARLDTSCCHFTGVADLLINGNQYFATGVENSGGFATYTATYTGLAADAGKPMTIELSASSQQGDFDNVRLSDNLTTTTPEPASIISIALLATVGAVLRCAAVRRRQRRAKESLSPLALQRSLLLHAGASRVPRVQMSGPG
jgi:hypothetical protein